MHNGYINKITLDCLLNNEAYNKCVLKKNKIINNNNDRKFYKNRIYDLTKKLLTSKEERNKCPPDIIESFNIYINNCIYNFKCIDKNDINQDQYIDHSLNNVIDTCNNTIVEELINEDTINNANKLIININKNKENNVMDNFVIKKNNNDNNDNNKNNNNNISNNNKHPIKKKYELRDPKLKNKGIGKKNNIDK